MDTLANLTAFFTQLTAVIIAFTTLIGGVLAVMLRQTQRKTATMAEVIDEIHNVTNSRLQRIEDQLRVAREQLAEALARIDALNGKRNMP